MRKVSSLGKQYGGMILFFCLTACNKKEKAADEPRIAKTVPAVYYPATDKRLQQRQDTVYEGDHFFTGHIFLLYKNGDTASIRSYFNGVEEGGQYNWYDNGQLAEERFYINGKKEGLHRSWWPDGKPRFRYAFRDNLFDGAIEEWNAAGQQVKSFHYTNGSENGRQQLWWDDGTVRANFETRNGRRYGLTGFKNCVNPYDSVVSK